MAHALATRSSLEMPPGSSPRSRNPAAAVAVLAVLVVVTAVTLAIGLARVLLLGASTDGSVTWE